MPSTELLLAFLATTAIFSCIPGPAMLYAAARTLAGGRLTGFLATLGIHLGGYVHVISAAAGLSIVFHAMPLLYLAVKLAGAAYLVWLGIGMFRSGSEDGAAVAATLPPFSRRALVESITVEALNPKTAIFFMAFLPQFVEPSAGAALWLQFLTLGTIANLMFSVTDVVCVLLASAIMTSLRRSSRGRRMMRRAGGSVLVGLGAHIVLQRN